MRQFTRCANCRQWYLQTFTTAVEIFRDGHLQRLAVWCLRCVADAEHRSHPTDERRSDAPGTPLPATTRDVSPNSFQQLVQEHLALMDRAMHEADTILVPLIEDFMQRCQAHQPQESPEQAQRLAAHLQYWAAFLKALNQAL